MDIGSQVFLPDGSQGAVKRLPRSMGRKRPRALVTTLQGDQWVFLDELKEVPDAPQSQD